MEPVKQTFMTTNNSTMLAIEHVGLLSEELMLLVDIVIPFSRKKDWKMRLVQHRKGCQCCIITQETAWGS